MGKFFCVALLFLASCSMFKKKRSGRDDFEPQPQPDPNMHVVMVIDSHIDPQHEAYKDKVLGAFTLVCHTAASDDELEEVPSAEEIKSALIKKFKEANTINLDSNCKIEEGINTRLPEVPQDILALRDTWNNVLKKGIEKIKTEGISQETVDKMHKVEAYLQSSLSDYHGTNVAAAIAYKNPHVKFILLQRSFSSTEGFSCEKQEKLIPYLRAYQDKQIQELLREKGILSTESAINKLAMKFHVTMINKSYGSNKYITKAFYESARCPSVIDDMVTYGEITSEIEEDVAKRTGIYYDQQPYLTFQGAGNDNSPINSKADSFDCSSGRHHMHVGSYDLKTGLRSNHSNYGDCVDVYSLGTGVLTSNPHNFLTVVEGTSFATPLMVRYASFEFAHSMSASQMRSEIDKRLDKKKFLRPSKHFAYAAWESSPGQLSLAGSKKLKMILRDEAKIDPSLVTPYLPGISGK